MRARSGEHLAPARVGGRAAAEPRAVHDVRVSRKPADGQADERENSGSGSSDRPAQRVRPGGDRAAEEVGRPVPRAPPPGTARLRLAPALGPFDGFRPLRLEVRPGRPVVDASLELAPAALEGDPRELLATFYGIARDRPHPRADIDVRPTRVVATDALGGGAAEVQRPVEEVRVRARRRMHHGMGPADELELVVAPGRPLARPRAGCTRPLPVAARAPRQRSPHRRRAGSSPSRLRACCSSC